MNAAEKKILIIHVPVFHKGYLDFLKSNQKKISRTYLFARNLIQECGGGQPDIASLDPSTARNILNGLGFSNVSLLSKGGIGRIKGKKLILVQDEVSRSFYSKYLKGQRVEWGSVFLRWDKDSVVRESPVDVEISRDPFDVKAMKEAYREAQKSSDWWRQVGAVAVKNKKIIARSYNQGVPNDHAPYQVGAVRDFLKPGERPELANYIHAEQKIVAEAAKSEMSVRGASLYVTHFPCPVCTKLIVVSGIAKIYFSEGSSALDGKQVLESAGVRIFRIAIPSQTIDYGHHTMKSHHDRL